MTPEANGGGKFYRFFSLVLDNKWFFLIVTIIVLAWITGQWEQAFGLLDRLIEYIKELRSP